MLCLCVLYLYMMLILWLDAHFDLTNIQAMIFKGHTNEKNFVGLTVNKDYLACGSETNEVFVYQKVSDVTFSNFFYK